MTPRSTIIAMFGSSFPVWIFAALGGVFVALILREILIVAGLSRQLPAAGIFYLAVALIAGILINYLWIGSYG